VAAYAAAQDLPAEVAARAGAQGAPLVDLNALPAVRAQPEVSSLITQRLSTMILPSHPAGNVSFNQPFIENDQAAPSPGLLMLL
jgi:hypothetical protein